MNIRFGFAVNNNKEFEDNHFGDAEKFLIYELKNGKLNPVSEFVNSAKFLDEEVGHGSQKKAKAIIDLMKQQQVQVMVAKQFGKNIGRIVAHFVPVVIKVKAVEDAIKIVSPHLEDICQELKTATDGTFKPFILK